MPSDNTEYTQKVELAFLRLGENETDEALELCQQAARLGPLGLEHLYVLGLISVSFEDLGRGIKFMEEGHRRAPNNKEFADALAALTARVGNMSESMYYAKLSLVTESNPDLSKFAPPEFGDLEQNIEYAGVSTYFVDAQIAYHERDYRNCVNFCGKELAVHPDHAECYQLMGRAWTRLHEYDEAVAALSKARELAPGDADNILFMGDALMAAGRLDEAGKVYQEGVAANPDDVEIRNRLVDASAFGSGGIRESGLAQLAPLSEILIRDMATLPLRELASPHADSRFIVGFVINESVLSETLCFVESIFRAYDRDRVKVIVYQQYSQPYSGTVALRQMVDDWRPTYDIDDATLDLIIRNDKLSALVDLCGARPGHRRQVLRGRPAPVNVDWLAFPYAPLGATADAILVDDIVVPSGGSEVPAVSLGESMVAYGGGSVELETGEDAEGLAAADGHVTFGAFMDPVRVMESAALWAGALRQAPGARLLLGAGGDVYSGTKDSMSQLFDDLGVADRVNIPDGDDPAAGRAGFLAAIDILLEARHVCNPSLICDALWMGAPVVAPGGSRPTIRIARSVLNAAGKADWVGDDDEAFIRIAAELAGDADRLEDLRGTMRDDVTASPLCDEAAFAARFIDALRSISERPIPEDQT